MPPPLKTIEAWELRSLGFINDIKLIRYMEIKKTPQKIAKRKSVHKASRSYLITS